MYQPQAELDSLPCKIDVNFYKKQGNCCIVSIFCVFTTGSVIVSGNPHCTHVVTSNGRCVYKKIYFKILENIVVFLSENVGYFPRCHVL